MKGISYTPKDSLIIENYHDAWNRVKDRLKAKYGESTYRSWMASLQFEEAPTGRVILTVSTKFIREWVINNYLDTITSFWQDEDDSIQIIDILVRGESSNVTVDEQVKVSSNWDSSHVKANVANDVVDFTSKHVENNLGSPLDPRFTFEKYVVGESNELAYRASRSVAENVSVVPGCNPLFLYGGVGLGKTHLLHAIAWEIRAKQPDRKIVFITAERFMYQFIRSIKSKDTFSFKEQFRAIDVLLIDDIQFISGKESTLEEFFHTFNTLTDSNKQIVITCDRSPSDLMGMGERARSRLGWGLVADVHSTDFDLRLNILESKVRGLNNTHVPHEVMEFIASKITSNVRELEGALNKVVAHASLMNRSITLDLTKKTLVDLLRSHERCITVSDIQKLVSEHYKVSIADITSSRRARNIARPRQIAMYLSKKLTTKSLIEIGQKFGGKDHTTVMHAVRKVEDLITGDQEIGGDVSMFIRKLQGL